MHISAAFLLIFLFVLSFLFCWLDLTCAPWYRKIWALSTALCAALFWAGR